MQLQPTNIALVTGTLSRDPSRRDLPSGGHVVELDVTVREDDRPATSVPVSWPDGPDRALEWTSGTEVVVLGRVHRRFFRSGGVTASRTEVVADAVVTARQSAKVASTLAEVQARLP
jgi:single-strand DNA-binding protein